MQKEAPLVITECKEAIYKYEKQYTTYTKAICVISEIIFYKHETTTEGWSTFEKMKIWNMSLSKIIIRLTK